ncbi:MAG: TRAP transporter small permease [Christensenellaceae bacterium]|nr:TRAP transporter small permease [Christensenellaceae bacterium]
MPKIFQVLDKIRPVYDITYKVVMFICKILLIIDILVTTFAVIGRYVPFIPNPSWTEQVVLTCMVYMAVLSATLAIRKGSHIRMTALDNYMPKKLIKVLDVLADIAVLALGIIMLYYGWKVCQSPLAKFGKYESMPWLSRFWMYFPIPLAGGSMIIFEIESLYTHIRAFFVTEEKEANAQ